MTIHGPRFITRTVIFLQLVHSSLLMGFNVEVAYCVDPNNSYTPPAFVSRGISAFSTPNYITLSEPTTSSIGRLYANQTVAYVDPYQGSCTVSYQSYDDCNLPQFHLYTSLGR